MNVKKFLAASSREAYRLVREVLGADAVILSNRTVDGSVEILALASEDVSSLAHTEPAARADARERGQGRGQVPGQPHGQMPAQPQGQQPGQQQRGQTPAQFQPAQQPYRPSTFYNNQPDDGDDETGGQADRVDLSPRPEVQARFERKVWPQAPEQPSAGDSRAAFRPVSDGERSGERHADPSALASRFAADRTSANGDVAQRRDPNNARSPVQNLAQGAGETQGERRQPLQAPRQPRSEAGLGQASGRASGNAPVQANAAPQEPHAAPVPAFQAGSDASIAAPFAAPVETPRAAASEPVITQQDLTTRISQVAAIAAAREASAIRAAHANGANNVNNANNGWPDPQSMPQNVAPAQRPPFFAVDAFALVSAPVVAPAPAWPAIPAQPAAPNAAAEAMAVDMPGDTGAGGAPREIETADSVSDALHHARQVIAAREAEAAQMNQVVSEIRSMRGMLESQLAEISWSGNQQREPVRAEVMRELLGAGFSPSLSRYLAEKMPTGLNQARAMSWIKNILARNLNIAGEDDDIFDNGGVFALVGPTGVGKTTTTAKLAARCVMRHGTSKLALITTDGYRIGGFEQLRIYGKILGVMVHSVKDDADLRIALEELKHKHTVLIDTVGVSQRDNMVAEQVAMLAGAGTPVKRLLCMSATSTGETLSEVVRAYQGGGLDGCILTKLDEAATTGSVLDVAIRQKLRLYFVANGQRVPEDLYSANAQYLIDRAFRLKKQSATYALRDDELSLVVGNAARSGFGEADHSLREVSLG
jgi:flagellar biosynthesis protein FlhF